MHFDNSWNVPENFWCFGGEPVSEKDRVYLSCMDYEGQVMAMWENKKFNLVARADEEQHFVGLTSSFGRISWTEADEASIKRSFEHGETLKITPITNLGTFSDGQDSFFPYSGDSYFFKTRGETPQIWSWKKNEVTPFFNPNAIYIFSPYVGAHGEIVFKTRSEDLSESGADRIWQYLNGEWKVVLEDKDANTNSPWISFRNQMSVDGEQVLVIAKDSKGEALILVSKGQAEIIARTGIDLARFDFFTPKLRSGVIVARGENFRGEKVTYVKDESAFRPLISQGDIVHTDLGLGRVHYQNQDSIFYGAPGIDENGNVILQATLTDPDHPRTLLGIGLIKFTKE